MDDGRDALGKAREDLAAGRPWVARDRAAGLLAHRQGDPEVLEVLGDAWAALGDDVRAGRYWFLTGRDDPAAIQAVDAFVASHPDAAEAARVVGVLPGVGYAPAAVARISALRSRVEAAGGEWTPGRKPARSPAPTPAAGRGKVRRRLMAAVVFFLTIGVWSIGVAAIIRWFTVGFAR
ncbi:MAG: hypothetical protein QOH99_414 [Frankiaceae bacterium]|nr:hypothetical protein [Frankiaceae bacterium]